MSTAHSAAALVDTAHQQLVRDYPQLEPLLKSILSEKFPLTKPGLATNGQTSTLTTEEYQEILHKLQEVIQLPGTTIEKETLQYIEQQLCDLLGFEISTSNLQFQLPFQKGTIKSLPHLSLSPTLKRGDTNQVSEAGQSSSRSFFGWQFASVQQDTKSAISEYWISLPIRELVKQAMTIAELKKHTFKTKFCVINPQEELFCIAQLMEDFLDPGNRYQLGGSPVLIREGGFWSPSNLGSCLIFLIEDQSSSLKPGCYQLNRQIT